MRFVKFAVIAVFAAFALLFFAAGWLNQKAAGRTSGGSSLAAPTGVTASDSQYATKVGINWDAIKGATLYRVLRAPTNDPAGAVEVGSTLANYLFDGSATPAQSYYYWVRAENATAVSSLSAPDQGMRAVGTVIPGAFPPLEPPIAPAGNPVTAAKAYLGKALFWDEQMSSTKTVSCGTCHRPAEGGSDPRTSTTNMLSRNPGADGTFGTADDIFGSPGVIKNNADGTYTNSPVFGLAEQVTNRKAPSYLNAGYSSNGLFWDGRATDAFRDPLTNQVILATGASLESQVLFPPVNSFEMGHAMRNWNDVAARIASSNPLALATEIPAGLQTWIKGRSYPQLFQEAFGTPDVTPARIAMAIATHERTLFSDQTPLDRSTAQIEPLTPQEESGKNLFVGLQCNTCHDGSLLSDQQFHNIGVRPQLEDRGRGAITGLADDNGRFRTTTLRNVELHAPYMHNGRFATLEEVIDFYNRGGDFDAPNIDHGVIRPLNLTPDEKASLVAFLKRPLTDERVRNQSPPFDKPRLYTESERVPQISGVGRAGAGGLVPNAIAIEPALAGNPSFTVAVNNAPGGAAAVLVISSSDPGIGRSIPGLGSFARVNTTLDGSGVGNGRGSIKLSIPSDPSSVGLTFYGRWYIQDAEAASGFSVSRLFTFTVFGNPNAPTSKAPADFDGDGKTDLSVYRPSSGGWYTVRSGTGSPVFTTFGISTDKLAAADYDGDGRADIGVFRDGVWYLLRSRDGFFASQFGIAGDMPQPADYDGDGKADLAVFRPSTGAWYIQQSRDGFRGVNFGALGDRPVAADYDGDEKADVAVYRNGTWFTLRSSTGFQATQFGTAEDMPVIGDYDGDGKSDIAVFRPSNSVWFYLRSSDGSFNATAFGSAGDVPSPGDYDGDRRSDLAVFRSGAWYALRSSNGSLLAETWGTSGDLAVPSQTVP